MFQTSLLDTERKSRVASGPFAGSLAVHGLLIAVSLCLSLPVMRQHLPFTPLYLPAAHPKPKPAQPVFRLLRPPAPPVQAKHAEPSLFVPPPRSIPPPVSPSPPAPPVLAAQPPAPVIEIPKPQPVISTGAFVAASAKPIAQREAPARVLESSAFAGQQIAAAARSAGIVTAAGFQASVKASGAATLPEGVRATAFGDQVSGSPKGTASHGILPSGAGFGTARKSVVLVSVQHVAASPFEAVAVNSGPNSRALSAIVPAAQTPLEILFKPRPAYSEEGRRLRIEGEVLLEAVFEASGKLHVLRVIRGLGHGLDENAIAAAKGIRFRPAIEQGRPVEAIAVVKITFQLAD